MKTIPLIRLILAGLLLAAASPTLPAQPTDMPPRRPAGGLPPERPPIPMDGRFMQPGPQNLVLRVLTDEQRASFRQAMEGQRDKLRELEPQLFEARKELTLASVAEKFDENLVRTKALAVARLDAEISVLRAKALSQIKPPLSAGQIEQLKNPPAGNNLPNRALRGAEGSPSIRPQQRSAQRDENDLPAPPPARP